MDRLETIAIEDLKSKIGKINKDIVKRLEGADLETVSKAYEIAKDTPKKQKIQTTIPISKTGGVKGDCGSILKQHFLNISSETEEEVGKFTIRGRESKMVISADSSVIFGIKAVLLTGSCRNKGLADACNELALDILKLFQKGEYVTKKIFIDSMAKNGNVYRDTIIDALEELLEERK